MNHLADECVQSIMYLVYWIIKSISVCRVSGTWFTGRAHRSVCVECQVLGLLDYKTDQCV